MKSRIKLFVSPSSLLRVSLLICFALLASSGHSAEQHKTIVLLESMPVPVVLEHSTWFLEELRTLGYVDGVNSTIIRLSADGDRHKARTLIKDLLKETKPDLVVTNATLASQEAKPFLAQAGIPQLFFTVTDPVGAGLIAQMGEPTSSNITGMVYSLSQKSKINTAFQLISQLPLKRPVRFGLIYSSYPSSVADFQKLSVAADEISDITLVPYLIPYRKIPAGVHAMLDDVRLALQKLEDKVDFWWHPQGPLGEMEAYSAMLHNQSSHVTAVGATLKSVEKYGSLLHMSPDRERYGRKTGRLADAILTGTEPGIIPVMLPDFFVMGLNLQTALELNIVVPSEIFELAGEHVYR